MNYEQLRDRRHQLGRRGQGPDGDGTGRPVGLVYIAVDTAGFSFCKELHLSGDRAQIREQAADAVFQLILDTI